MIANTPAGSFLRLAGVACAVVALVACRATSADIVAEHRPAVDKVFAQFKALDAAVRAAPVLTEDRIDVGTARVVLEGPESNALFVRAEHLLAPEKANLSENNVLPSYKTQQCAAELAGAAYALVAGLDDLLISCGRAEYLFVHRAVVDVPAKMIDATTFEPGRYEGEVLLFRLADGALLGGFRVTGKSSDSLMLSADENSVALDPLGGIHRDLRFSVDADINAKLPQFVPGVLP
jgi:hypothetical protein